ncbi:hypothetical protein XU18_1341 [Perkinsela sp. CCAP 1560/4]|nr:hypothetical protein XU18_1341 [Perkinsela sp. CCAP 1560/4]|eukprot:KNH08011.1 hypothetical protein XU18_1341 [Perkinsela sp. CCAP 1560/4]
MNSATGLASIIARKTGPIFTNFSRLFPFNSIRYHADSGKKDLEIEIIPYENTVLHEQTKVVKSLDVMAMGRILNYLARAVPAHDKEWNAFKGETNARSRAKFSEHHFSSHINSSSSNGETCKERIEIRPIVSQGSAYFSKKFVNRVHGLGKKYQATIEIPVHTSQGNTKEVQWKTHKAIGIAMNDKDAKVAAAMHAEEILSYLDVPLCASSRLQKKYAESHPKAFCVSSCIVFDSRKLPSERQFLRKMTNMENEEQCTSNSTWFNNTTKRREIISKRKIISQDSVIFAARSPFWSIVPSVPGSYTSPFILDETVVQRMLPLGRNVSSRLHINAMVPHKLLCKRKRGVYMEKSSASYQLFMEQVKVSRSWKKICRFQTLWRYQHRHTRCCPEMSRHSASTSEALIPILRAKVPLLENESIANRVAVTLKKRFAIGYGFTSRDALISACMRKESLLREISRNKGLMSSQTLTPKICALPILPPQSPLRGHYREVLLSDCSSTTVTAKCTIIYSALKQIFAKLFPDENIDSRLDILHPANSLLTPFLSVSCLTGKVNSILCRIFDRNRSLVGQSIRGKRWRVETKLSQEACRTVHQTEACGVGVGESLESATAFARLHLFDQILFDAVAKNSGNTGLLDGRILILPVFNGEELYVFDPQRIDCYANSFGKCDQHDSISSAAPYGPSIEPVIYDKYNLLPFTQARPDGNFYSMSSSSASYFDPLAGLRIQHYFQRLGLDFRDFVHTWCDSHPRKMKVQTAPHFSVQFSAIKNRSLFSRTEEVPAPSISSRCGHSNYLANCVLPLPISEQLMLFYLAVFHLTDTKESLLYKERATSHTPNFMEAKDSPVRHMENLLFTLNSLLDRHRCCIQGTGIGHSNTEAIQLLCMHLDLLLHFFQVRLFDNLHDEKRRREIFVQSHDQVKKLADYETIMRNFCREGIRVTRRNYPLYIFGDISKNAFSRRRVDHPNFIPSPIPPLPVRYECTESVRWMRYLQHKSLRKTHTDCRFGKVKPCSAAQIEDRKDPKISRFIRRLTGKHVRCDASPVHKRSTTDCRITAHPVGHRESFSQNVEKTLPPSGLPEKSISCVSPLGYRCIGEYEIDRMAMKRIEFFLRKRGCTISDFAATNLISARWFVEITLPLARFGGSGTDATGDRLCARGTSKYPRWGMLAACMHLEVLLLKNPNFQYVECICEWAAQNNGNITSSDCSLSEEVITKLDGQSQLPICVWTANPEV